MGFSLKKLVKSVSKPVASFVSSAGKAVETTVNGVGKVATGNVSEGIGDISQQWVKSSIDLSTGGNTKLVNAVSGGAIDTIEGAARGNTGDLAKVGVVAGATFVGGPMAGIAANTALAGGANVLQAGLAGATSGTLPTGNDNMSFLSEVSGFLGSNNDLAKLANGALQSFTGKPQPAPIPQSSPMIIQTAPAAIGGDNNKYLMIGGGVLALVLVLFAVMFSRKR